MWSEQKMLIEEKNGFPKKKRKTLFEMSFSCN